MRFTDALTGRPIRPGSCERLRVPRQRLRVSCRAAGVPAGDRNDCAGSLGKHRLTWLQLADSAGMATGIVSTARLTHATPAATWAHSPNRDWENDTGLPAEAVAQGCVDLARQMVPAP